MTYESWRISFQSSESAAKAAYKEWKAAHASQQAKIDALEAKLVEVSKDSERYRWLREQFWDKSDIFVVTGGKKNIYLGTYCPSLIVLDEDIDEAIKKDKQ